MFSCVYKSKVSISNDCESMVGWTDTVPLVKGDAHSGDYFTRTDSASKYSLTFRRKLKHITDYEVRRIDLGVWVRAEEGANAKLVVALDHKKRAVFWAGVELRKEDLVPGRWTRLYYSYYLPEKMHPETEVKVYIWNTSGKKVDADDFDIHFYLGAEKWKNDSFSLTSSQEFRHQ
ncbi:MAG: hypothetical protein DWQ44_13275 [Bacteroidetes bacterium]|nr:MAG: hypothetical protein DWQ33_13660 [Bacteroidota bacterium]REK05763.1 MAG: hypothetical protein DWQ39_04975 [Bacteroidota bacterium]REK31931.1 MAG: hypothetical protein DWQ44_13275 [Bacteroidota bacterium]REK49996.1 MAG: hypothetical protein DWQ48_05495 [Bacteroidota bacterium]